MAQRAERRWCEPRIGKAHNLPGELIVSLTSHPPRFATLHLTLKCLLTQSVAPDRVILWIAYGDRATMPREVLDLRTSGLQIEKTRDLGSYKKLIPALFRHPSAFIATADDDVYYAPDWLERLVKTYSPARAEIPCHRGHALLRDTNGRPLPYLLWRHNVAAGAAKDVFATGVGGALYPPGSLHPDVTNSALFGKLCPTCDDAWFYWMARRIGWRFRKIGPPAEFACWPGSQEMALQKINASGGNDTQIARLYSHFDEGKFPAHLTPIDRTATQPW